MASSWEGRRRGPCLQPLGSVCPPALAPGEGKGAAAQEGYLSRVGGRTRSLGHTFPAGGRAEAPAAEKKRFNYLKALPSEICPFCSMPVPLSPRDHQTLPVNCPFSPESSSCLGIRNPRSHYSILMKGPIGSCWLFSRERKQQLTPPLDPILVRVLGQTDPEGPQPTPHWLSCPSAVGSLEGRQAGI